MNGGTISGNTSGANGGGVYQTGYPFTMKGSAKISGNTANNGGGVSSTSAFNMEGGVISGNIAVTTSDEGGGGGVYIRTNSFDMSGGTIGGSAAGAGNTAKRGGGVLLSAATLELTGTGSISHNTATAANGGGGVYKLESSARFTVGTDRVNNNTPNDIGADR
jgi:hypothetical protein